MSQYIPIILLSSMISFVMTPLVKRYATSMDFVDKPKARKLHAEPIPMMGGIAMYAGIAIALLFIGLTQFRQMLGVLGGLTLITLIGLWDDRIELSPAIKMLGIIAASAILPLSGVQVSLFSNPWLNIGLTLFWVIGICNAVNFLDNMDGLAAGVSMIASGFFFLLAFIEGLGAVAALAAAVMGASAAFLYYNFNPASLFMGDAGSLQLGYALATLGIQMTFTARPQAVTWMIPLIVLGLPLFDTTLVVISRLRRGQAIWQGGKDHTSHRLTLILGMTPARAVMTLYLVCAGLGLLAIMLVDTTPLQARLLLAALALIFIAGLIWFETRFIVKPATVESPQP